MEIDSKPSWIYRRRVIFTALIFCALSIVYLLMFGKDIRLHETIVNASFLLAGTIISCYVFGATWDDRR